MKPVYLPNLPTDAVTAVIIDGRASFEIKNALMQRNILIIQTLPHPEVYSAIAYHPDIMLHHIEDNLMVYAPNTPKPLTDQLSEMGFKLKEGHTVLKDRYPGTIAYNVARVGKYAFHNTKYTDPVVRELLEEAGVKFIDVKQGYAKCLTCIVNENSIITSDKDIHSKAAAAGIDALLIEPDKAIRLEPFDMGFIGGATGLLGKNKLAFAGNLSFHKNFKEILSFLSLKCSDMVMLNDERLMDLGTIIPIMQK
ncbi:hypothetical protein LY28_01042 [Ruminiclostridium sufflavum DSM 19573]|uniref:DUF6873 domain-containing protein n=1 Tax=Ruminiclostridium sufflavum DSM 19573 TaxID=1121337 RepID=A0A318Y1J8_9FIRM|nr:hypothetical protein [Ruminiclostridium sufflavum]PYG89219.1 hypothetical protein LY28_01042 [Ruminiclostridium sufflavum DSM 19573]